MRPNDYAGIKDGRFVDSPTPDSLSGTLLSADLFNSLTLEILNVLKAASISPIKTDESQLAKAIDFLIKKEIGEAVHIELKPLITSTVFPPLKSLQGSVTAEVLIKRSRFSVAVDFVQLDFGLAKHFLFVLPDLPNPKFKTPILRDRIICPDANGSPLPSSTKLFSKFDVFAIGSGMHQGSSPSQDSTSAGLVSCLIGKLKDGVDIGRWAIFCVCTDPAFVPRTPGSDQTTAWRTTRIDCVWEWDLE